MQARSRVLGPFSPSFNINNLLRDGLEKVNNKLIRVDQIIFIDRGILHYVLHINFTIDSSRGCPFESKWEDPHICHESI